MIDGLFEFVVSALAALSAVPLAFFFPCNPCCGGGCGRADGKPRTDPANEGTWVPSGTWRGAGGVTWTFAANPGDDSGETWFFYGSIFTSAVVGQATSAEAEDWGNICNWYSNKTTSPSTVTGLPGALNNRATRLPPVDAVVHIYTDVSTVTAGPQTVKHAYFWNASNFETGSEITITAAAHDSDGGAVFNDSSDNRGTVNGGATLNDSSAISGGIINGGAVFNDFSFNFYRTGVGFGVYVSGTVNGGAVFNDDSDNLGTVNDGAVFNDFSIHNGSSTPSSFGSVNGGAVFNDNSQMYFSTVNDGAVFNDSTKNERGVVNGGGVFNGNSHNSGTVNDGAVFNDSTKNFVSGGFVIGGATFNDSSENNYVVEDFTVFNDNSENNGIVRFDGAVFNGNSANNGSGRVIGGAVFNDNSLHDIGAEVQGGATFNDAACSKQLVGDFFTVPCSRQFVANSLANTTCNGTAPDGCANSADTCGCG